MTDLQVVLADAWNRLAEECVETVRIHHDLINRLSRAGLLPSPAATALTANVDQLEAQAAEIRRRASRGPRITTPSTDSRQRRPANGKGDA